MTINGLSGGNAAVGRWLRHHRAAAGLTQEELAERSGISVRAIGDLERGRTRKPYASSIRSLADALEVPFPGQLLDPSSPTTGEPAGRPPRLAPRLLPAGTAAFTGRQDELAMLADLASGVAGRSQPGVVTISAVNGMAGIGKTALAIHAAHLLAGQFPDGQLFADLHGYTSDLEPMPAGDALDWFLRCLGIPAQLIPHELDARASFYRDRLAGTRTLIVLDNAASTAQIRPLIPGTGGCLVVVTSRKRLTGLDDTHCVTLGVLAEPEAITLFHVIAGAGRVSADDPAVARVVTLCGRLPLAIRIAAARLRHQSSLTLDRLAAELDQEHQRLSRLTDDDRSLAVAFDLSYRRLPSRQQAMFLMLGLVPGPDVDAYGAAALTGTDLEAAAGTLDSLLEHNLLQSSFGRFWLHDLLRLYARDRAAGELPAEERSRAVRRLLDYYQQTAQLAEIHLARATPAYAPVVTHPPAQVPELASPEQAMAWMHAELRNITAAIQMAAAGNHMTYAVTLPAALAAYLDTSGPYRQAVALHGNAAEAATTLDDRGGLAAALDNLGRVKWQMGNFADATAAYQRALDLYTALGNHQGQASAINGLGAIQARTGDFADATAAHQRALDLYTALGDRRGQASALDSLGVVQWRAGNLPAAATAHQRALDLYTVLGDRRGQALTVNGLGIVRMLAGNIPAATAAFLWTLDLFGILSDRRGQALALTNLGMVRTQAGDYPGAAAAEQQALKLFAALGDGHGQANALDNLAVVLRHTADYPAAAAAHERSLELFRELGDPLGEAEALNHYGALLTATGQPGQARACHLSALDLARGVHAALEEALSLEGVGEACLAEDAPAEAGDYLRQALALSRALGVPDADRIQARLTAIGH